RDGGSESNLPRAPEASPSVKANISRTSTYEFRISGSSPLHADGDEPETLRYALMSICPLVENETALQWHLDPDIQFHSDGLRAAVSGGAEGGAVIKAQGPELADLRIEAKTDRQFIA